MWPRLLLLIFQILKLFWQHKDALKGLDKHQRKRVAGDAVIAAEDSARKFKQFGPPDDDFPGWESS